MGFAASDAGDRRGEEVFQLENAAWSRDELVGRHAAYRALMHLDGSRDVAQDQRPKMLDSMQEEAVLLAHDLAGDAKDRRRPLVQRLDQPVSRLEPLVDVLALLLAAGGAADAGVVFRRSEEHTSELQSLMRISYAVFC